MRLQTPYYKIYERQLLKNMRKIEYVRETSGAKSVLALKCFSTWAVFELMSKYMAGTTSSSLYEAKLGYEKFGGETHAFCTAYSKNEISELKKICDKIIFNSVSQLNAFHKKVQKLQVGLRINPGVSYSHFDLADPARKNSRLGVTDKNEAAAVLDKINGVMFHYNCENGDFFAFSSMLDEISRNYGEILDKVNWVSLGGGVAFTQRDYPINDFCKKLKSFAQDHGVQVYLEPGEAAVTGCGELVTQVLDVVRNEKKIAVVNACTEAHALDLLIYRTPAKINAEAGKHEYIIAGKSCLAGDVFGEYKLAKKLEIGSTVKFADLAGYTMVKKNWFNGLEMPAIIVKRLNGKCEKVKEFSYADFVQSLS